MFIVDRILKMSNCDISLEKLYQHYADNCEKAEAAIKEIEKKLDALQENDIETLAGIAQDQILNDLIVENRKLKYRINIMKRGIEELNENVPKKEKNSCSVSKGNCKELKNAVVCLEDFDLSGGHMVNILGYIEAFFTNAILKALPNIPPPSNVQIQVSKVSDYQCNAAMSLAKTLKKNPKELGQSILDNAADSPVFSSLELSGPGFINVALSKEFIRDQITNLIKNGVTPPPVKRKRVVVDFSSPNIAKEMHVGHLSRQSLEKVYVVCLNFLAMILFDRFPNFESETPPIQDLQAFYKESKKRFDEDPDFKKRAYEAVVQLQSHDELHYKAWKQICKVSEDEFQKVYQRLNVTITSRGESFYQSRMEAIVKELDENKLLSLEEGRKVMYADGADIPLTIVKSDGGYTYDTSDMACLKHRIEEEKADWIIYVTDAGQSQHFKSFLSCGKRAGFYDPSKVRIDHVTFGVVLGEDKKKFKTRSGDTVRLIDLLNEGVERAEEILKEKERQNALTIEEFNRAKEAVAYGCIKYADLSHDRTRDYVFSFDRMLDFKAGVEKSSLLSHIKTDSIELEHEKEWKLAKILLKLPDVIVKLAQDLYPHPLCEFLYEISTAFTEFYDNCYCIEKDSSGKIVKVNMHRLLLCEATAIVMDKCFDILGIKTLEKM
ncbi:Arginine--tRNA ligase, cytoplasmic [Armadillidium vulgare]|nr:Arginine--tRNA ligase, cytoplasmic [Armadillidium vulgare]